MSIFGWSYPPGAAGDPSAPYNQEEGPCEICGEFVDDCICPECGECGECGNPACYKPESEGGHGMARSEAQKASLEEAERRWEEDARAQAEAEDRMFQDWKDSEDLGEAMAE